MMGQAGDTRETVILAAVVVIHEYGRFFVVVGGESYLVKNFPIQPTNVFSAPLLIVKLR